MEPDLFKLPEILTLSAGTSALWLFAFIHIAYAIAAREEWLIKRAWMFVLGIAMFAAPICLMVQKWRLLYGS